MKLFIVSTDTYGYEEFISHVVAAKSSLRAKKLVCSDKYNSLPGHMKDWKVLEIGTYYKEIEEIVHSSFNAG